MLETLSAADFEPFLGKTCDLILAPEARVRTTIHKVMERPNHRSPLDPHGRTPFSVWFLGQEGEPAFESAICSLQLGETEIEGVYINRMIPAGPERDRAWYQLVFN
ncbi:MAG: hypothetical protein R6X15_04670 [Pseudomonadota bacterium]